MLIEQTTTYAYKLKYLENPSFDKVRNLAKKFIDELPKELVDDLYNSINRGVDILKTEPEMLVYLYSFGNMHQAKLNFAFDKIPEDFFSQSEINVIDYGCGQAIGTMCYADFLKSKNYNLQIKSVTLIEPSKKCLRRAALHTSIFFPDAEITTVNKTFDELAEEDINCGEDVPTLHILSNVLDLEFNISKFTKLVKGRLKGYNQFVCVGPYFGYDKKDFRMEDFAELVGGDISFSKAFGKGQFVEGKNWTCQVVVASVGELEEDLSTEVSLEEIENGVEDEFGVVYSRDGKRLLKNNNRKIDEYEIRTGTKVICNQAFLYCISLREIKIPNTIVCIGSNVFQNCESLQCIRIPNSVREIGDCAFCKSICEITIPNSVRRIGDGAFTHCSSITIIHNHSFVSHNHMLVDVAQKKLLRYYGNEKSFVIPNSIKIIGDCAFNGCSTLQEITIPTSVMAIGSKAFENCKTLKCITIPKSVTSINDNTFSGCKSLQHITIPDSITNIGKGVFAFCWALRQIIIPKSVLSLGNESFFDCKLLQEITIQNSDVKIDNDIFGYLGARGVSLQHIFIPRGSMGHFKQMLSYDWWDKLEENLSTIVTEDDIKSGVEDEYGVVYSIDGKRLLGCNNEELINYEIKNGTEVICDDAFGMCHFYNGDSLEYLVIPETVVLIGKNPFVGCKKLISHSSRFVVQNEMLIDNRLKQLIAYTGSTHNLMIPNTLLSIGDSAFYDCKLLQYVTIPNTIKIIGREAFSECRSLVQISIPDSVSIIGDEAFAFCSSLKQVLLPESVEYIGDLVFKKCESIKQITIPDNVIHIGINPFRSCYKPLKIDRLSTHCFVVQNEMLIDIRDKQLIAYLGCSKVVEIPDTIVNIGDYAFFECTQLQKIIIPNSVRRIGVCAVRGCISLQQISIPNSVSIIDDCAFYGCKKLEQIVIPNSVTSIGLSAFSNCVSLQHISIPDSVKHIGIAAFNYCISLKQITLPNSVSQIEDDTFMGCKSLEWIAISDSITAIGKGAFNDCVSLKDFTIPESVISIGNSPFRRCTQIISKSSNFVVQNGMLIDCKEKKLISYVGTVDTLEIPSFVQSIGDYAFQLCAFLKNIQISNSVTTIGKYAFSGCSSLQSIKLSNSIYRIDERAFSGCKSLQYISLPNSISFIGNNAFASCVSLREIIIPNTVIVIGGGAFAYCKSLQQIIFPNSVMNIGKNIFGDKMLSWSLCNLLQKIIIPKGSIDKFKQMLPQEWWDKLVTNN